MPPGISSDSWAKNREQAELQLIARETGVDTFRLLQPQPESGFSLLPNPSPGDLFFDFEGNPFWDASGSLEYLWGILDVEGNFEPLHAHDHESERLAFERFVDLVHERLARHPDLHVYHYAAYEITALKRLMAATARASGSSTTCSGATSSSTSTASSATGSAPRGRDTG